MKRLILPMLFGLLAAGASYADQIFYDTTTGSQFNCTATGSLTGCGTDTVTIGGVVQLTYQPGTSGAPGIGLLPPAQSNANFGSLVFSCVTNTSCGPVDVPTGLTLTININQTGPDVVSGAIPVGTIEGSTISGTSSGAYIVWTNTSVTLQGTTLTDTYAIQQTLLGLYAPNTGGGLTTIQGEIIAANAPEPAISLLCASGLVLFGTMRFRRKKA